VRGDDLLAASVGIAAATGSACHAGTSEPSAVPLAMGLDRDRALGALRLSLGRWTTADDVDRAIERVGEAAEALPIMSCCVAPLASSRRHNVMIGGFG
jgi:cysteine desulfurase